jgi:glucose-1-phosphate cytidylyltransferase
MTYGDGVSDVNVGKLLEFHKRNNVLATVSAVQPPGRFGSLSINSEKVDAFVEKPLGDGGWINAGFFVLEPKVLDYIAGDAISWENEPLERLAHDGQLAAYKHRGFWQAMDTLRDCKQLNTMWDSGKAPWMVWDKQEATVTDAEEDFTPSPNIRRATIV